MNRLWMPNGDPDLPDFRSMTPEQRKNYVLAIDAAIPRLSHDVKGAITIFGTGGDVDKAAPGELTAIFYSRPGDTQGIAEERGKVARYFSATVWDNNEQDSPKK